MIRNQIQYEGTYNGHPVNASFDNNQGCYVKILNAADNMLTAYTNRHCRTLAVRFDLRYPCGMIDATNSALQRFCSSFGKALRRESTGKHQIDPAYLWVREINNSLQHHYHIVVLVNGSVFQVPQRVLELAELHWGYALSLPSAKGLVHFCLELPSGEQGTNYYQLQRGAADFDQVYDDCFKRISYMAKDHTKGNMPKNMRMFGTSRIPK